MKHHKKKVLQSLHMFVVSSHAIHIVASQFERFWKYAPNLISCNMHMSFIHVYYASSFIHVQYTPAWISCDMHQSEFCAIHTCPLFMCNMHHPLFMCNMHQCEFFARCTNLNSVQICTHPSFMCKTYSPFFHEQDVSIQIPCNTYWYCIHVHTILLSCAMHTSPYSHAMHINSIFICNTPYA